MLKGDKDMNKVNNVIELGDFLKERSAGLDSGNAGNEGFEGTLHDKIYPLMTSVQKEYINSLEKLAILGDSIGNDDVFLYREVSILYYKCGIVVNQFESMVYTYHIQKLSKGYSCELELEAFRLTDEATNTLNKLQELIKEFECSIGKNVITIHNN